MADMRKFTWEIKKTETLQAKAIVNVTDLMDWAHKERRGQELNDLSADDFRLYMQLHGTEPYTTSESMDEDWDNVQTDD